MKRVSIFIVFFLISSILTSAFIGINSTSLWPWDPQIKYINLSPETLSCNDIQMNIIIDSKGQADLKVQAQAIITTAESYGYNQMANLAKSEVITFASVTNPYIIPMGQMQVTDTNIEGNWVDLISDNNAETYTYTINMQGINCEEILSITYNIRLLNNDNKVYDSKSITRDNKSSIFRVRPFDETFPSTTLIDFSYDTNLPTELVGGFNAELYLWNQPDIWNPIDYFFVKKFKIGYLEGYRDLELTEPLAPDDWYWGVRITEGFFKNYESDVWHFTVTGGITPSAVTINDAILNADGFPEFSWNLAGDWNENSSLKLYYRKTGGLFGENLWTACDLGINCDLKEFNTMEENWTSRVKFSPGKYVWGIEFKGADGKTLRSEIGSLIILHEATDNNTDQTNSNRITGNVANGSDSNQSDTQSIDKPTDENSQTNTSTPQKPTETRTSTPPLPTEIRTSTPPLPTVTRTSTPPLPTATRTSTPPLPTVTRTSTPPLPTVTRTSTPPKPTVTSTITISPTESTLTLEETVNFGSHTYNITCQDISGQPGTVFVCTDNTTGIQNDTIVFSDGKMYLDDNPYEKVSTNMYLWIRNSAVSNHIKFLQNGFELIISVNSTDALRYTYILMK